MLREGAEHGVEADPEGERVVGSVRARGTARVEEVDVGAEQALDQRVGAEFVEGDHAVAVLVEDAQ
jgi:hypothetical protein